MSGTARSGGGEGSASGASAAERCALAESFLRASTANGRFDQAALSQLRRVRSCGGRGCLPRAHAQLTRS